MLAYIPVSLATLPEFLSSGFVGLTASLEPDEDMQTGSYPDVLAYSEPYYFEEGAVLEVEVNIANDLFITGELSRLSGPLPMSLVRRIVFPDDSARSDFEAIYKMLPDIPLEHFRLDVEKLGSFQLSEQSLNVKVPKFRRRTLREDPSRLSSTFIGVREAVLLAGEKASDLSVLKFRNPTNKKICIETTKSLLSAAGYLEETPAASMVMLNVYCDVVEALGVSRKVETPKLLSSMQACVEDMFHSGAVNQDVHHVTSVVLEKTRRVMTGMEAHSALVDTPSLILQRAVCLACIAVDLESFDAMRRNLSIGVIVESIARLLVATRLRLSRVDGDRWRATRTEMDMFLNAAAECISKKSFSLEVECTPRADDFSCTEKILICGLEVSNKQALASHEVMLVASLLRSCGYSPRPDKNGNVQVLFYPKVGDEAVSVVLMLRVGPTQAHRKNLQVSASWLGGGSYFSKKQARQKIMKTADEYMVSISEGEGGGLVLSRYQLLDTMDKDELNHHVELVAGALGVLTGEFEA